jgi:hypothetical protein
MPGKSVFFDHLGSSWITSPFFVCGHFEATARISADGTLPAPDYS